MDEILYDTGSRPFHLRLLDPMSWALSILQGPQASKKLCQPDNVTATKFRWCMTVPMRSTYLSAYNHPHQN